MLTPHRFVDGPRDGLTAPADPTASLWFFPSMLAFALGPGTVLPEVSSVDGLVPVEVYERTAHDAFTYASTVHL